MQFCCPITLELLGGGDPVVMVDGHTYERAAIVEWLRLHNTSPVTGDLLKHKDCLPNLKVREILTSCYPQHQLTTLEKKEKAHLVENQRVEAVVSAAVGGASSRTVWDQEKSLWQCTTVNFASGVERCRFCAAR